MPTTKIYKTYLHIGAHKTGSTLIQRTLQTESEKLLEKGIFYNPKFYDMARFLNEKSPINKDEVTTIKKLFTEIQNDPIIEILIASGEAFAGDQLSSYINSSSIAADLRRIIDGEVEVILFTRRQDTYFESQYQMLVKGGSKMKFEEFIQSPYRFDMDWNRLIEAYATVFGDNHITVMPYESFFSKNQNGFLKFMEIVGSDFSKSPTQMLRVNQSMQPRFLEILRRSNDLIDADERWELRKFFEENFPSDNNKPEPLLSDEQRKLILRRYEVENRKLFDIWMPDWEFDYSPEQDQKLRNLIST